MTFQPRALCVVCGGLTVDHTGVCANCAVAAIVGGVSDPLDPPAAVTLDAIDPALVLDPQPPLGRPAEPPTRPTPAPPL
ncbi:MAG: hypothetical protein ABMB14_17665, partial [Myxococcota bacterium]